MLVLVLVLPEVKRVCACDVSIAVPTVLAVPVVTLELVPALLSTPGMVACSTACITCTGCARACDCSCNDMFCARDAGIVLGTVPPAAGMVCASASVHVRVVVIDVVPLLPHHFPVDASRAGVVAGAKSTPSVPSCLSPAHGIILGVSTAAALTAVVGTGGCIPAVTVLVPRDAVVGDISFPFDTETTRPFKLVGL